MDVGCVEQMCCSNSFLTTRRTKIRVKFALIWIQRNVLFSEKFFIPNIFILCWYFIKQISQTNTIHLFRKIIPQKIINSEKHCRNIFTE